MKCTIELTANELIEFTTWLREKKKPVHKTISTAKVRNSGVNGMLGVKLGKTSKYHYVFFSAEKWMSSMTIKGRNTHVYTGDSELDAAKAVDAYLDKIGDSKRPRNFS